MSYEHEDYPEDPFPKDFGYCAYDQDGLDLEPNATSNSETKPRILLMGLRRSGKSSIQKVVFHKMSPNETLFLESTSKIVKDDINNSSFVQFQIWDFPGQIDFIEPTFDSDMIFGGCGALVFVIDAKDDYIEALTKFKNTVIKAYKVNPRIKFEVFIHKVDGISDDSKMESQRDIHQRSSDDLSEAGLDQIHLSFHLTSIYDHSIFEAFSKVVQKLIPQLPTLENLLNIFIPNSGIEKAFLFDVVSKIYIATDSSPVDMQAYELCCDMIDMVIDLSSIYSSEETAFDSGSSSLIKLNNNTILYMREVNKFLALVCILREENFNRQGVIDYNFICFRDAISEVFELRLKRQKQLENADQDDDELADDQGITIGRSSHENDTAVVSRAPKIT
ncbi:ras-related GTP-binding protein C [Drosophila virilis]|uniref:Ras-related GTP-binding protein C n=1 Tax=Drosophila virilis TaxID=7244 RepID=B4LJN3_DROVI|nr:ras-related GTP-binding protein C [Drosophila virilis]EDW61601.1 uncharacterized protein Dvir_GJ20218 [Drosophila virilis]